MAIVGISGHKRSGKDLTANIIQYLLHPGKYSSFTDFQENSIKENSGWKIVKYADKLKDIVCILTGCTREDLESEEFKNSRLSNEWAHNWIFSGLKSTHPPTYREVLQYVGTNLFRNKFHQNTWLNATMANYKPKMYVDGYSNKEVYPNWIVTDVRFLNEIKAIKERGGIVIRINRLSVKSNDKHESETALDNYTDWDYVIENNDNLQDLIKGVEKITKEIFKNGR